jgi:hypothetical protein
MVVTLQTKNTKKVIVDKIIGKARYSLSGRNDGALICFIIGQIGAIIA